MMDINIILCNLLVKECETMLSNFIMAASHKLIYPDMLALQLLNFQLVSRE